MTFDCILGIDPGASGACAFLYPSHPELIAVYDAPVVGKEINASALYDLIQQHRPQLAVIESVHAFKGQGVSSSFNFGAAFGVALGVIGASKIPLVRVTPGKWKKYFSLDADKEKARALAISKWPASEHFRRKMDHGRAEAALLALYGAQTHR